MKRTYFDFFDSVLLEVRGEGGRSTQQFRTMYDQFRVPDPGREPDVVVERTTADVDVETVLGDPNDHYGWTGERFVVRNGGDFMAADPGWDHIYVTPGWEPFYAIYPVEFRIRRELVEEGKALVHASGVELDGETTLFPAWRGAGKTNTLLSLLRAGADFLSDDRLWAGSDGTALGFPLSVNLQPYNVQSFPEIEIEPDDLEGRIRSEISEFVEDNVGGGSIVGKGINYVNSHYIQDEHRRFTDVETLFPRAKYLQEATVDNVVVLQAAPGADHIVLEEASVEETVSAVTSISHYEWDARLEEYFRAYDSLCPGPSMTDELEAVVDEEERIFRELFEGVDTYRAWVPREADWGETGLDREMVELVESLGEGPQAKAAE